MRLNWTALLGLAVIVGLAGVAQAQPGVSVAQPSGTIGAAPANRAAGGARATSRIGDATEAESGASAVTPLGDPNRAAGTATAVFGSSLFEVDPIHWTGNGLS